MKKWDVNEKPKFDFCPEQYCFCWTPPGGTADLSGKSYGSFEDAVAAINNGVTFLHGGCAALFRPCQRETNNPTDKDCYEPHESILRKDQLPELIFCNPENLDDEFIREYNEMTNKIWKQA
ncbi:hypothetical protein ACQE3E_21870 [Methylomonas sp. MED-D]|uniref:hypothetical protein n=1 Tax=unclassified Methylomonas TaxID=2608980 RepID=UPI0024798C0D|nr:hypothetical protein [Methylomonas sp. UP202]WGS85931.1 hypothetical protein QC632_23300 [Methylomonas sp. UP202]